MGTPTHNPVLLDEALAALAINPNGCYMDGTFGRGGHSAAILDRLSPDGRLIAIDRDEEAVAWGRGRLGADSRFGLVRGSFSDLASIAEAEGVKGAVDGVLLDLGVSSPQLDDPSRGFSFLRDGPLDMRMDRRQELTAAVWIDKASERELSDVIHEYGEERFARRVARAIKEAVREAPVRTTGRLAEIVAAAIPKWEEGKHPATRTFQAIRIFINKELDALQDFLDQVIDVLRIGGRVAIITFHSLEDRLVKRFFRDAAKGDAYPKGVPVTASQLAPKLKVIGKALAPSAEEIDRNVRARSARLRVAERLA